MWSLFEICTFRIQNRGLQPLQVEVFHFSASGACSKIDVGICRIFVFVEELVKLFCSNYWQNPLVTAFFHYFHCNSHHHYHFHNHCKMQLYCLKILPTIPCLFQLNVVFILIFLFTQKQSFTDILQNHVKFVKFLRRPFFTEHFWWLLLFTLSYLHLRAYIYFHLPLTFLYFSYLYSIIWTW